MRGKRPLTSEGRLSQNLAGQVEIPILTDSITTETPRNVHRYAVSHFPRNEQSTDSPADFLKRAVRWYARRGVKVERVQTDNGFEFTNRFSSSHREDRKRFYNVFPSRLLG